MIIRALLWLLTYQEFYDKINKEESSNLKEERIYLYLIRYSSILEDERSIDNTISTASEQIKHT